ADHRVPVLGNACSGRRSTRSAVTSSHVPPPSDTRSLIVTVGAAVSAAKQRNERYAEIAAEFVRLKVDVSPASHGQWAAAFVQRLRELGWVEGRTVARPCGAVCHLLSPEAAGRIEDAHPPRRGAYLSKLSNFEIVQQQQHVHDPDIRKMLNSLSEICNAAGAAIPRTSRRQLCRAPSWV